MRNRAITDQPVAQKTTSGKILLVTGNLGDNYGNVLQRYAMSHVLKSLGFEVTHLLASKKLPAVNIKTKLKNTIKFLFSCIGVKKYWNNQIRKESFDGFKNEFMFPRVVITYKELFDSPASRWNDYDYVLVGSDVVWAYHRTLDELKCHYLGWVERERRINYAPSFGYSVLPDETQYEIHRAGLEGFDRLSCREKEGCEIIEKITGRKAQAVLDPTLLLDAGYWRKFSRKPTYSLPERYVLVYLLPDEFTPESVKAIRELAGGLPIIDILNHNIQELYATNPAEFVYLIDHADLVCTNSFHGVAFSINLGKNFLAFGREIGFPKVGNILNATNLMNHIYHPDMTAKPDEINIESVSKKLNEMRATSMSYLRECLNV